MKKNMMSMSILSMFLLLSVLPITTIGQNVETSEQTQTTGDDLPDLTIELEITTNYWWYIMKTIVRNEGTADVPAGTRIVVSIRNEDDRLCSKSIFSELLRPGEGFESEYWWPMGDGAIAGKEIITVVDPLGDSWHPHPEYDPDPEYGLIIELNEDNNIDTVFVPKARSRNTISQGGLIDNINVELIGTPMLLVVMNIWDIIRPGQPSVISYLDIDSVNNNDEKVTLNAHLIVDTRDGRTIFENTITDNIPAKHGGSMPFSFNRDTLVQQSYLTGIFDATLELYVEEDGSQKTLSFKGFFFNYGSIVFNPRGKVIA